MRTPLLSLVALAAFASTVIAAEPPARESLRSAARGLGAVTATATYYGQGTERSSWTAFVTGDAAHAGICASKRLADLTGFGGLAVRAAPGLAGTVVAADGVGAWLLGVRDAEFHEFFAPTLAGLPAVVAQAGVGALQAVAAHRHPRWLDCFDEAGAGVWVGGGGDDYDLTRDFAWLQERGLTMCTMAPRESRLVAPGVVDTSINDWHAAMAAAHGLAYRSLLFPGRPAWAWNRVPLPYVEPEPGYIAYPFKDWQASSIDSSYEPDAATDPWLHDLRRRLAAHLGADANFLAGHGTTEVPNAGILELATVAGMAQTRALWRTYLQDRLGLDLAEVGRRHAGDAARYRSWDELTVPVPEDFLGWDPATCLDLRGAWEVRPDVADQGRAAEWFAPGKGGGPAEGWTTAGQGDVMIQVLYRGRMNFMNDAKVPFWMRRAITVPPGRVAGLRYLHISRNAAHANLPAAPEVWLGGTPLKRLTADVRGDWDDCYEIGGALREGANQLVMDTHGHPIPGYIFIGPEPLRLYPAMDAPHDRRWFDAVGFSAWLRMRALEENLAAQRSADPDRPLKMMALINLLDVALPLAERYGAYFHDTGGAAGFWAPMTGARLSATHGLPWSCEQGGPPGSVAELRKAMTMYLMLGNDAMDLVFSVGHYRRDAQIAAWFDGNPGLIHAIGKMKQPAQAVGVLRSSRATRLGFDEPWNWDIGRGELQAVGRDFSYLELPDLQDGTAQRFRVIVDDGTILMADEDVAGLERYVRQGGVFIAQHLTGRHAPERADAWPIARLTGVTVTNRGVAIGGTLRFSQEQALWPQLRGRDISGGWGMALDVPVAAPGAGAVEVIARWGGTPAGQGSVAVAARHLGKGMVITLGSTFWRDARDGRGAYPAGGAAQEVLDELLTSLGVPRESWTGSRDLWADRWQSKNGVFDAYPVANMGEAAAVVDASVALLRDHGATELIEASAPGLPRVPVTWADGRLTLPKTTYGPMQSRVFLAPRADRERAGLEWLRIQAALWRPLPPVAERLKPAVIAVPEDVLPLADGWRLSPDTSAAPADGTAAAWTATAADDAGWRTAKLGTFATLGLAEGATARFRRTIAIPPAWQGRRLTLVFDAEPWFWGLLPEARLWINGQPAGLAQPIRPSPTPGFSLDVTAQAGSGTLVLALEIAGGRRDPNRPQARPNGATGMFTLLAERLPLRSAPLPGPWQAARSFNALAPLATGAEADYVYLQTAFTLPALWPAPRLFLEADGPLGCLVLNGRLVDAPRWMRHLDISGLVRRDGGANSLRWLPALPEERLDVHHGAAPVLRLAWQP